MRKTSHVRFLLIKQHFFPLLEIQAELEKAIDALRRARQSDSGVDSRGTAENETPTSSEESSTAATTASSSSACVPSKRFKLTPVEEDTLRCYKQQLVVGSPDVAVEFAKYVAFNMPVPALELMQWWKKTGSQLFPLLNSVAEWLLQAPPCQTASERNHSSAKTVVNDKRSRLEPDFVDRILTIKSYLDRDKEAASRVIQALQQNEETVGVSTDDEEEADLYTVDILNTISSGYFDENDQVEFTDEEDDLFVDEESLNLEADIGDGL